MQYYNFRRLIEKYSRDIVALTTSEGYYDDVGDWQNGDIVEKTFRGAAINHRESKIFRSEGKLTGQDVALYMLNPLENSLHGAQIVFDGKVYSVGEELQNGDFTGIWAYTLKYVSAFKETRPDYDITEVYDDLTDRLDGVLTQDEEETPETSLTDSTEELKQRLDGVE